MLYLATKWVGKHVIMDSGQEAKAFENYICGRYVTELARVY